MNDRSCRLCRPLPVFVRVRSFDVNGHSDHNVHSEPNLFKRLHIQEFIKSRDGGDSSPVHSRLNLPASQADSFVSTTIRFWQVSLRRCASSSRQSIKQPKQNFARSAFPYARNIGFDKHQNKFACEFAKACIFANVS